MSAAKVGIDNIVKPADAGFLKGRLGYSGIDFERITLSLIVFATLGKLS